MMNKQEAVEFIYHQLLSGRNQEEISSELVQLLHAPGELVSRFVEQVALTWEPESLSSSVVSPSPANTSTRVECAESAHPGLLENLPGQPPAASSLSVEPVSTSEARHSASSVDPPVEDARSASVESQPSNLKPFQPDALLVNDVVKALSRNQPVDDVILMVCDRTRMEWSQAQSFIDQLMMTNRKKLISRQNIILIPLTAGMVIGGLALILASLQEIYGFGFSLWSLLNGLPMKNSESGGFIREALTFLVVGLGIFLGGTLGLFRALKSQFE